MDKLNVWDWRKCLIYEGPDNSTYKLVLLTLSCFMNANGKSCFPSIDTLEDTSSLSRPTVIKYLKKAEDDGWIKIQKRGKKGKAWSLNEYFATIPKAVKEVNHQPNKEVKQLNPDGGKAVKLINEGGKTDTDKAVKGVNSNSTYNKPKSSTGGEAVKQVNHLHPLQEFVKDELPEVSKLDKQLAFDDCETLINDFGKTQVHDVLLAMENKNGLTSEYKSVYRTIVSWCKYREENENFRGADANEEIAGSQAYSNDYTKM